MIAQLRNGAEVIGFRPDGSLLVKVKHVPVEAGADFATAQSAGEPRWPTVESLEKAGLLDAENAAKLRAARP